MSSASPPGLFQRRRRRVRRIVATLVIGGQHMRQRRPVDLVHQRSNFLRPHRHAAQHAQFQRRAHENRTQSLLERHDTPPRATRSRRPLPQSNVGTTRERSESEGRATRPSREAPLSARRNGTPRGYDGRRVRRQEDEDRRDDQPLERYAAGRQECREYDQGNAGDGERPAGSWHCRSILART